MAKNGKNLHENYRSLVDEITHADIDLLMGKRGSTNSAVCLVGQSKAESCATNLRLSLHPPPSPTAVSPISENKSFDSAVSSGIRSDHFLECCPVLASSSDLARFDLRVNSGGAATPGTLRRTSKSSSSHKTKNLDWCSNVCCKRCQANVFYPPLVIKGLVSDMLIKCVSKTCNGSS